MRLFKISKIGLAILILLLLGITLSAQILIRQEERKNVQDIEDKGTYLVSLISLYPLKDFAPERRSFFLRTLTEYTSPQGLLYLIIHGENGRPLISVAPTEVSSRIPETVQTRSVYTTTFIMQSYQPAGLSYTVYEFAKPIFENGRKSGAVRVGLKLPKGSIFSTEKITLLAMMAFFIFAALSIAYYGMTLTLKSVRARYRSVLKSSAGEEWGGPVQDASPNGEKIMPILKELEQSLGYTNNRLNEIKEDNIRLMSRLGTMAFEKNQIIKALDSINFGIIIADLQDHITFVNDYMLKLTGHKRDDVINKRLEDVFQESEIRDFLSRYEMAEARSGTNFMETRFSGAPGEFRVSLSHLTTPEKTVIGKMIFVRDVTSISMAKRAQQEFTAHVSHEMMTSLTNIRAYSEMLMDGEVENPEMQKEFYNTINQETKRLTGIIQNLLSLSKMEMGNLTLNKGLLRTDSLLDDCLSAIEASARAKGIEIETHLPDVMPTFMADKELLKTAIINILGNSVKYTAGNGSISVFMYERDSSVVFEMADTGYGIAPEDLPHIFEKFYRSTNPLVSGEVGTGLGLSIAYEIVHLHDGDIEVQSKLGEGTRFTIRIPKEEYTIGKN